MTKPLAALLTTSDLAARLGARPVHVAARSAEHLGVLTFLRLRAVDSISRCGEIPILTRDGGPVYAWPVQPGPRVSGAGL